jgi:hypothetical protein
VGETEGAQSSGVYMSAWIVHNFSEYMSHVPVADRRPLEYGLAPHEPETSIAQNFADYMRRIPLSERRSRNERAD